MKKRLITIVLVAALALSLVISASAASFTHLADQLNSLGLFEGTGSGYDLERAPKRGEALAMMIRLYGLDDEARASKSGHPFADLTEAHAWLAPYVAYAYENGYTTGTTETTFSPDALCSAQMYVTYVLRALGYSDKDGDFTYDEALSFGADVGIVDGLLSSGEFLRDQMVAVSYLALQAAPKGGEYDTLLDKLVADSAVDGAPADAVKAKLALFDEVMSVGLGMGDEGSQAAAMNMHADAGLGDLGFLSAIVTPILSGMGVPTSFAADAGLSVIYGEDVLAALTVDMDVAGEKSVERIYVKDGFMYIDSAGEKTKMEIDLGESEEDGAAGETSVADAAVDALLQFDIPLYIFSEITKTADGDYTVYTMKVSDGLVNTLVDAVSAMLNEINLGGMDLSAMDLGGVNLGNMDLGGMRLGDVISSVSISDIRYYTDSAGALKKITAAIDVTLALDLTGTGNSINLPIKISMEMEITAVGDAVTINFPDDLDTYVLVEAPEPDASVAAEG